MDIGASVLLDKILQKITLCAMKTKTLSIRVDNQLIADLEEFERSTGIERASLVRAATRAALDHFGKTKKLVFPIRIVDSSSLPKSGSSDSEGDGKK